jgi:hypothetical protein
VTGGKGDEASGHGGAESSWWQESGGNPAVGEGRMVRLFIPDSTWPITRKMPKP